MELRCQKVHLNQQKLRVPQSIRCKQKSLYQVLTYHLWDRESACEVPPFVGNPSDQGICKSDVFPLWQSGWPGCCWRILSMIDLANFNHAHSSRRYSRQITGLHVGTHLPWHTSCASGELIRIFPAKIVGSTAFHCIPHLIRQGRSRRTVPSREPTYPPKNALLKMIFLFPRWNILVPWRVCYLCVSTSTKPFIYPTHLCLKTQDTKRYLSCHSQFLELKNQG